VAIKELGTAEKKRFLNGMNTPAIISDATIKYLRFD